MKKENHYRSRDIKKIKYEKQVMPINLTTQMKQTLFLKDINY